MLTQEDLEMTKKYMDDYTEYCRNRECGEGCPVFDMHQKEPKTSCFRIYCRLRENKLIPDDPKL